MSTTYEDILNLFRENDRQIKELLRSQQETEQLLKQQARETDQKLNKLEQLFTSQWGKLMESLVEGDLVSVLNAHGIAITDTTTRLKGKRPDGGNYEFDILAHNGEELVVVEVKTTLKPDDVKHFIQRLNHFKTWLPRYAGNRVYGAMAWLTADAGAEAMVENRGLFSIRATGNSAQIVNPPDFRPHAW